MLALAIVAFATEALKAFNAFYADAPAAERQAGAMLCWNVGKLVVYPLLSAEQRAQLDALVPK